ncbi:uncharacterized protein BJ212DRAFT_1303594 [Suillus subaureus]|uniref:Uncharacterized protein n=1 Tax=Suillus subaureus TaxID=48587 RepID=A0A9P7J7V0_9AGAM|nr:uncharacterized protein BJ212DRAFT_1303594 [Suillus subaureus]KAG1807135.1 hypothetical protein BJ212DRAFT_1303594 [Suillus subaureus]
MPGASWITHEQSNFLKSKVDGFCMSQLQGDVAAYITNTNREWFTKWPEVAEHFKDHTGRTLMENELTNEQMKQLGVYTKQCHAVHQIHSFLYHVSSASGRSCMTQFMKTITKIMSSTTNHTHGPSAVEHYIQTKYKSNPNVKAKIKTQLKNNDHDQKRHISALCLEAAKSMAACGDSFVSQMENEAKMECARHAEEVRMELEALCNPSEVMRLQSLEGLSGVVGQLLDIIHETTGWHGSMYLGGPDPQVNGEVRVFSFHHGKGATRFNFQPFTAFLKGTFSSATSTKTSPQDVINITAVEPAISIATLVPNITAPVPNIATPVPSFTTPVLSIAAPVATQTSPLAALHGLGESSMLQNGIHYSLDELLSFDPDSIDFSQVDTSSFSLPMLSGPPPSPRCPDLPILPAPPVDGQDSPMSSYDGNAAATNAPFMSSPPRFHRIESNGALKESCAPHPHPVTKGTKIPSIYDHFDIPSSASPAPLMATEVPSKVPMPLASEVSSDLPIHTPSMSLPTAAPSASEELGAFSVSLPAAATLISSSPSATPMEDSQMDDPSPMGNSPPNTDVTMQQPFDDIINQSCHCSNCSHVPSTRLEEANHIGSENTMKKGHNRALPTKIENQTVRAMKIHWLALQKLVTHNQ